MSQPLSENQRVEAAIERFNIWINKAGLDTKKHQLDAMRWCLRHELSERAQDGIRGGLVADEMGLGKTIVMLGLICSNFRSSGTLIILPPALLDQWSKIIERFFGHEPAVYHGRTLKKYKAKMEAKETIPIMITTYGILMTRKESDPLFDPFWDLAS